MKFKLFVTLTLLAIGRTLVAFPGIFSEAMAQAPSSSAPAATPPALVPVPLDEAIIKAATALMVNSPGVKAPGQTRDLVVDPLIDGFTGAQNTTTTKMGINIESMVKASYPQYRVVPFKSATIANQPYVLVGTFRPINTKNLVDGPIDAYHICLALLDLQTGKVVAKGVARAMPESVDVTPVQFFQDSPVWVADPSITSYIKTCQATQVGENIDAGYADRVIAASLISDAITAYNARRYKDAYDLYRSALRTPTGDQLRVYNGLYLTSWRLKRPAEAAAAFSTLVDYGLKGQKVAVNFLFNPNSTIFETPKESVAPYEMWLGVIGERGTKLGSCLEIVGHTSKKGPAAVNDRLSTLRAQYVRDRIIEIAPDLAQRTIATGVGSRQTIIGTLTDGPYNAIDRRVEFKTIKCAT